MTPQVQPVETALTVRFAGKTSAGDFKTIEITMALSASEAESNAAIARAISIQNKLCADWLANEKALQDNYFASSEDSIADTQVNVSYQPAPRQSQNDDYYAAPQAAPAPRSGNSPVKKIPWNHEAKFEGQPTYPKGTPVDQIDNRTLLFYARGKNGGFWAEACQEYLESKGVEWRQQ